MAISINWGTRVITVPKADMTVISASPERYELNIDTFRLALKALEDDAAGMPFPDTHRHNTTVTLSGVVYARSVEIINGYTVEFDESLGGNYGVVGTGANSNILDVKVDNTVSYLGNNSAGLVEVGSGLSPAEQLQLALVLKLLKNRTITDPVAGTYTVYDDDDSTVLLSGNLWEDAAGTTQYDGQGAERRDRLT